MTDRGEFRATTDRMLTIIDRLRATEERKRTTPVGTPEFVECARQAEVDARLAFRWAQMQLQMAEETASRLARGAFEPDVRLVSVVPRPIDVILANWREAQLRLEIARPGSSEASSAADAIERLREEYHAAHEALANTDERQQSRPATDTSRLQAH